MNFKKLICFLFLVFLVSHSFACGVDFFGKPPKQSFITHTANAMNIAKGVVSPITQTYSGINHIFDGNYYLAGDQIGEASGGVALSIVTYGGGRVVGGFSKVPRVPSAAKGVGKAINGVDDVLANPNLLQGKSLEQVQSVLGNSKNWVNDMMRKSTRADGWVLREMNQAGTNFTGRMIQYHPGTPRHFGGAPYWKVSSGNGTFRIPLNP